MQEDERIARMEDIVQPILRDHGLTLVDLSGARAPGG